jgi:E1A/CREB-binding protein
VPDTTDEDSPFESELFESRQQFLNYCQTTYSQFDELRRAKHTSLMILFLLHNPSAPKFVQQCGACYNDITHGIRHHCRQCSNFDLCEKCYEPVTSGQWAKKDPRFAHPADHRFVAVNLETDKADGGETVTAAERMRSLKKHVELLEHAAFCAGRPECTLQNCQKMKDFLRHVTSCDITPKRDCKICKKILSLCTIHARFCSFDTGRSNRTTMNCCPIPFCDRLRDRNTRLRRQQQLMDDRRRQAQNELYHASSNEK